MSTDKQVTPIEEPDLVVAQRLDHGSGAGRVLAGLDFRLPGPGLAAVVGPGRSGKSLLLSALVGRVRRLGGSLEVAGHDVWRHSRDVRRLTTPARIGEFVDVEDRHTVGAALRERCAIEGMRGIAGERAFRTAGEVLGLDAPTDHRVEELPHRHRTLLSVALACVRPSRLIVLDDADRNLPVAEQRRLYEALDGLVAHTGTAVVVSTNEITSLPAGILTVPLPPPGAHDISGDLSGEQPDSDPRPPQHSR